MEPEEITEEIIKLKTIIETLIPAKEFVKISDRPMIKKALDQIIMKNSEVIGAYKQALQQINDYKREIQELRNKQEHEAGQIFKTVSYAAITAKKQEKHLIIIQKNDKEDKTNIKQIITNKINLSQSQVGVSNIRETINGKVVIECKTREDKDKLEIEINNIDDRKLTAREPIKNRQKIIIRGVNSIENTDEIMNTIYNQNREIRALYNKLDEFNKENRVIFGYDTAKGKYKNIIVETSKETTQIIKQGIAIGWETRKGENYIEIKQCFKCQGFGHTSLTCKGKDTCGKCAGNHRFSECESAIKKCINCVRENRNNNTEYETDHQTRDSCCDIYSNYYKQQERLITYHAEQ